MFAAIDWISGLSTVFKLIRARQNRATIGLEGKGGWRLVLILITVVCQKLYVCGWNFNCDIIITGFKGVSGIKAKLFVS